MNKPCLKCGTVSADSYCDNCQPNTVGLVHKKSDQNRARQKEIYNREWVGLSARARKLQPYCSDCGTQDNLTADHTPAAHAALAEGRPVRLEMLEVVCRSCNSRRGPAHPGSDRFYAWAETVQYSNDGISISQTNEADRLGGIRSPQIGAQPRGLVRERVTYPSGTVTGNKYSMPGDGDA